MAWTLWVVTGLILLQAVLGGLFISGVANVRSVHATLGWLLPVVALAPAVLTSRRSGDARQYPMTLRRATALLAIGLFAQEMLGHIPTAWSIAVHVPFGVALFGASVWTATACMQAGRGVRFAG